MIKGLLTATAAAALMIALPFVPAKAGGTIDGKVVGGIGGYYSTGDSGSGGLAIGKNTASNSWSQTMTGGDSHSQAGHAGSSNGNSYAFSGAGNHSGASGPGLSMSGSQSGAEVGGWSGAAAGKVNFKTH